MVYHSEYPPLRVPTNVSVSQFLAHSNPDDVPPTKRILADFNNPGHFLTYGELRSRAAQAAGTLRQRHGLAVGDMVCLVGQNSVNWALLLHSVLWAGGCFCGINPVATPYELVHYFAIAKPAFIATDAAMLPKVRQALAQGSLVVAPQIIVIEDGQHNQVPDLPKFPRNFVPFQRPSRPPYDLSGQDNRYVMAGMCFSSGTSGLPKGVMLSHHGLIAQLLSMRATNPLLHNAQVREVFYPPFSHIYGLVSCVLLSAYVGHFAVVMKRFAFAPYMRRCAAERATVLRLVPATATRLAKTKDLDLDLARVRWVMVSGAALAADVVSTLQTRILPHPDVAVLNGYGLTEATVTMLRETQSRSRVGSLGRIAAGVAIRIVDDAFRDVPRGQPGQCLVQGPTLFMGYRGNNAETAAAFHGHGHDRWFCTGDIVRMDADGFLWMVGRSKELIKFRGNQVPPAELEAILLSHPRVDDAGVCGILDPDSRDDELPLACVTLATSVAEADRPAVLREVRAFLEDKVAPHKRLRGGLFHLDALPKNANGKLQRRDIPAALARSLQTKPKI